MSQIDFLETLEQVIAARASDGDSSSYTQRLLSGGIAKVAQKVGEEGVELALAGVGEDDRAVTDEAADLFYHVLVLLHARGLRLSDICERLSERHSQAT